MSPIPCSLLLEVYEPTTLDYDGPSDGIVAWEVSTDPAHATPFLLAPRQYAEQEIDPIACTATIGQIEICVIDPPEVPGDQTTGWMTARVHDLLGRRCRLTRYIDDTIGWIVIADGPAGAPSMDSSYSAYRWTIRDTRETERKLTAFLHGGTSAIVPRGSLYGFGFYNDVADVEHSLLAPLLDDTAPVWGLMQVAYSGGRWIGKVDFGEQYVAQVDPGAPTADTIHIWRVSLQSIDTWANGHRANGDDPYDMSSGHGNQGLDAIIVANGITVADFNTQATALGVSFGPGTAWIASYRDALVTALGQPSADPLAPILGELRLSLDDDAVEAIHSSEVGSGIYGARNADVLWRVQGDTVWNMSRPTSPSNASVPFAEVQEFTDGTGLISVLLFSDTTVPDGFPSDGVAVEIIIRYRGPASEAFPYYVEGTLGDVLQNFYDGLYSTSTLEGIDGIVYDPSALDATAPDPRTIVRYDPAPFGQMGDPVLLRQTAPVTDGRSWTESTFYSPSGWIPALDNDAIISPILRNRPATIDTTLMLTDDRTVPTAGWNIGQRTVSEIRYSYMRYFIPGIFAGVEVAPDGLAIRPITVEYRDDAAELRYGPQSITYDAMAFCAIGDANGQPLTTGQETANVYAQAARFDILERYRDGVQTFSINARRDALSSVRVGTWVPWNLSWFPDRASGLRGSIADAAQIISIRDDNCTWRTLTLEESGSAGSLGGSPGYVDEVIVLGTDEPDPGFADTLVVFSDEES